jgi:class 3 adenylate cyclase
MASERKPGRHLFRKYLLLFAIVVCGVMLTSGIMEAYFSYQENKSALVRIQREKTLSAASKIAQFIEEIQRQISWVVPALGSVRTANPKQWRIDFLRLLRSIPAVTEVRYLDSSGKEQLQVSRLAMDVVGSGADFSQDPKFFEAKENKSYFGSVYFRRGSEPYMSIAIAGRRDDSGVIVAEVNLKFVWEIISRIKVGKAGQAYATDAAGNLIAHPDISLVLKKTNLSSLQQVAAAKAQLPEKVEWQKKVSVSRNIKGQSVLTAYAEILPLGWFVFLEQPLEEAFEPLYASIFRTVSLLLIGIALSVLASFVLARRLVKPIQALQKGATLIGAGELDHRIEIRTGDELESLGEEFNRMTAKIAELENVGRLKRFFSPQLSELIVSSGDDSILESHRREIAVVFCDLRGFTAFSETHEPEEVMAVLGEFHETVGPMIFHFEGTLERFAGDGLMVFFNDPVPCQNPAMRAVRMSLAVREGMGELRKKWQKRGHDLDMGMGIAQGFATLGRIGFEGRFDYAAIGTVTNLAARLSDEARDRQIFINQRVYAEVGGLVEVKLMGELNLKGLHRPVTVYNVLHLKQR